MSGVLGILLGDNASGAADAAATTAFLARTSGLDATHTNAYKALINGLVSDGVFAKLDGLWMLATADATTSLLNLVSTSFNLTAVNSPSFTTDQGYSNSGFTKYLDTGITLNTGLSQYSQNSASLFGWNNSSAQSTGPILGGTNNKGDVFPRYTDDNCYATATPAGSNLAVASITDAKGLVVATRTASNVRVTYKNGSSIGSDSQASGAPTADPLWILGMGDGTLYWTGVALAAGIGSGLSAGDNTNLYNRLHTYLQTISGIA